MKRFLLLIFCALSAGPGAPAAIDFQGTQSATMADSSRLQLGTGDFTICVRFNADTVNYGGAALGVFVAKNYTGFELELYVGKLAAYVAGVGINGAATINPGTWYHAALRRVGGTIQLYLDGVADGPPGSSAGSVSDVGTNLTFGIRTSAATQYDGRIAEVAIYADALSADELVALAKGMSPSLVHPQSLRSYVRFIGTAESDRKEAASVSLTGTPTKAEHPRMYR